MFRTAFPLLFCLQTMPTLQGFQNVQRYLHAIHSDNGLSSTLLKRGCSNTLVFVFSTLLRLARWVWTLTNVNFLLLEYVPFFDVRGVTVIPRVPNEFITEFGDFIAVFAARGWPDRTVVT
jgi:hypothetical protein